MAPLGSGIAPDVRAPGAAGTWPRSAATRRRRSVMGSAQVQAQLWGRAPEIWSEKLEPQMRPFYVATLEALQPLRGKRLLDAGCGAGLALHEAAARGAQVAGLDATGPLLEVAARRTPTADLRQGDIDSLPFAASSFDVVTSFNAVQYAVDPAAAV